MATKSDMKGFYRQKKNKNGGITKSTNSKSPFAVTTEKSITPKQPAALGSEFTHSPALNVHGSPNLQYDYDVKEELLRQFDLNMAYGPSLGLSRLDRWERAKNLGLNPPRDVERLLRSNKGRVLVLYYLVYVLELRIPVTVPIFKEESFQEYRPLLANPNPR